MKRALSLMLVLAGCGDDGPGKLADAPPPPDGGGDGGDGGDGGNERVYSCGTFTEAPTWTLAAGFHAVVIADATDGLAQPVAAVVAGGGFGGKIFVVNQTDSTLRAVEPSDGSATVLVPATSWPKPPMLLTTVTWDKAGAFDGNLYVGDQGADADNDSTIFRVAPGGTATQFATAPGPGLDDIYGLAFAPVGAFGGKLYVTGDSDGAANADWGVFDATGVGSAFSDLAGTQGITFDTSTSYGGLMLASRPGGGGFAGDNTITKVGTDGLAAGTVVTNRPGIHAVTLAPPGAFQGRVVAASWSTGELLSIDPQGGVTVLASGLSLTNYDGNILAFSPDGRVLYVADRLANRLVCIEPL